MPKQKTRPNIVTSQRIKELRKLRKLTQADLASKIGKSDQMIRKYESGKEGVPTSSIYALAAALDCCPEYLWDATDCITQTEYDAEQAEIDSTIKKILPLYEEYWKTVERRERIVEDMAREFLDCSIKHSPQPALPNAAFSEDGHIFTLTTPGNRQYRFTSRKEWEHFWMSFFEDVQKVLKYHLYEYDAQQEVLTNG